MYVPCARNRVKESFFAWIFFLEKIPEKPYIGQMLQRFFQPSLSQF